jgi:signal transduction histidine kinase
MRLRSIQSRLMLVAFVFIVGTSTAMAVIGIRLTTNFLSARFHENFRLLATYMARNAELGVLLGDSVMLQRLALNMLAEKDIRYVVIRSAEGKPLASLRKKGMSGPTVEVSAPILAAHMDEENLIINREGPQEALGEVTLVYSLSGLDQLTKLMINRFILTAVILCVISIMVYWFLARSIVAPLNDLLEVSRKVSKGTMDVRATGGGLSETRTLASAFNEMLNALRTHRAELEEAHEKMSRQQTLAEVGKFSMMVAHEVKNPLSIIKGSLDILKKQELDPETKGTLFLYLEEEVARINRLMEDFLLFARPKEPDFTPLDINQLVRDLIRKTDFMDREEGPEIAARVEGRACFLSCDPYLMERALLNIIRNALEACGNKGRVDIETVSDDGLWSLSVTDSGPGISAEHFSRVFEPFFTTKAKGTGLGLAMAKGIVETHGGEITARNVDGRGACFQVRLKKAEGEDRVLQQGRLDKSEARNTKSETISKS